MSKKREFKIEKVTRTEMVKKIHEVGGRIFSSVHIGKDKKPHYIAGKRLAVQDNPLGYIQVHSMQKGEPRLINPQTVTDLKFNGVHYKLKK
jgi:hypothetical protein